MVFSIRHTGLESPEVLWRRNLRLDSLKLGEQLHGKFAKRPDFDMQRIAAGIIRPHEAQHFNRVEEYVSMRAELPKSFRNGYTLAQLGPYSAITNFNTGATYNKICDAVYLASTGDEIILPAGSGANNGSFIRYSNYLQLDSNAAGYTGGSGAQMVFANPAQTVSSTATYLSIVGIPSTNVLSSVSWASTGGGQLTAVISGSLVTTYRRGQYVRISGATNTGTGGAVPGKLLSINNTFVVLSVSGSTLVLTALASAGVYGTIGGSPILNNDRAQISSAIGYLTSTLTPGDTTIHLDDAADFSTFENRIGVWGSGDYTWQFEGMTFTGVTSNTLTGVDSTGLSSPVPAGNIITCLMPGVKAFFTPAATNTTGVTMTNLELWAALSASGAGIFGWNNNNGQNYGNLICNNLFIHDCVMGIRPGNSSVGTGTFIEIFNSELWRDGDLGTQRDHNAYVLYDVCTFYNSLSWQTWGVHLFKSRSRTNYMLYNRTYSDHGSAANFNRTWSANYDFPDGGLTYMIGCIMQQSEQDSVGAVRWGEEVNYGSGQGEAGTGNPISEIYMVNCTIMAPVNGSGDTSSWANNGPLTIGFPGLKNPEIPVVTSVVGGALPARSYWFATTLLDGSGNESLPSTLSGQSPSAILTAQSSIGANQLAFLASPIPRTGGVTYNVYAAHADPTIWWNSGNADVPPTGPNQFYYNSGFTLPVCSFSAGGSQPAAFVYVGVTYVFPEGESINVSIGGCAFNNLVSVSPVQTSAAVISVPVNNLLTIKSPPAMAGATGWYPNIQIVPYNVGFGPAVGALQMALSPQVDSPLAIGTDWVQSSAFRQAGTMVFNFYKQTASPITLGTNWPEPTSGLTNLNSTTLLKWRQIGQDLSGTGLSRWYAKATFGATNYVVRAYENNIPDGSYETVRACASLRVWSGTTSPWPFDADYPSTTLTTTATSATATTAASNTVIEASFRSNSTAGSGWTQSSALSFMMTEYKIVSSPQTSLAVTQTGGGSTSILVNAITGTSLALRGSPQTFDDTASGFTFTIPTIVSGDYIVLDIAVGNGPLMLAIDPAGPPAQNQSLASSPLGAVINNASAYYNPTGAGPGGGFASGGWLQTFPGVVLFAGVSYPTVSAFNLQVNTFNGTTFDAPFVSAVWTDAPNFDFTLVGGSPAIGAGTNPGSGHSFSLVPMFQTAMIGTPTPGYPIAALTARTDGGLTLGAIGSGSSPTTPGPRMRWMRFGWDWKLGLAILATAAIKENPTVSRRRLIGAQLAQ